MSQVLPGGTLPTHAGGVCWPARLTEGRGDGCRKKSSSFPGGTQWAHEAGLRATAGRKEDTRHSRCISRVTQSGTERDMISRSEGWRKSRNSSQSAGGQLLSVEISRMAGEFGGRGRGCLRHVGMCYGQFIWPDGGMSPKLWLEGPFAVRGCPF